MAHSAVMMMACTLLLAPTAALARSAGATKRRGNGKGALYEEALRRAEAQLLDRLDEAYYPDWMHEANAEAARRMTAMTEDQAALVEAFGGRRQESYITVALASEPPREWTVEEREALREVVSGLNVSSVEGDNPCKWSDVYCMNGHDVALYCLVAFGKSYGGHLSPAVGKLQGLRDFVWYENDLGGSVPKELGDLVDLKVLDLPDNKLTGDIPPQLAQLTKLWQLAFMSNDLTGYIPPETGRQSELVVLCYGDNPRLKGTLPPSLGNLTKLKALMLLGMNLTGPLPDTWSGMTQLTAVWLGPAGFSGGLKPNVLGAWTSLRSLFMHDCPHLGGPVPAVLCTHSLTLLWINGNGHTGELPAECGQLANIESMKLHNNNFIGYFPDTTNATKLSMLSAHDNKFSDAGKPSPGLKSLSFSGNAFPELPSAWHNLPEIQELDLAANQISAWPRAGVPPDGAFEEETLGMCGRPIPDRFQWPKLRELNVNNNPLNMDARTFLHSLGYLPELAALSATNCSLQGVVPIESGMFIPGIVDLGTLTCQDMATPTRGFASASSVDLSDNSISGVLAPAPRKVDTMKLARNRLQMPLHSSWWGEDSSVRELDVSMNPALEQVVAPPQRCPLQASECPPDVACRVANHNSWKSVGMANYECTSLCLVHGRMFVSPETFAEHQMCRCKLGWGGAGTTCNACPVDTYAAYTDELMLVTQCIPCPANSTTGGVTSVASQSGCMCKPGFFKRLQDQRTRSFDCAPCPEFSTTLGGGAVDIESCVCDTERHNVRTQWSAATQSKMCGCPTGHYMNRVEARCVECSISEDCSAGHGMTPPVVKAGHWAKPVEDNSMFAGHSIYRCFSKETCLGNSLCAAHRHGLACSRCLPGTSGGASGECSPCEVGPGLAVGRFILTTLPAFPAMVILEVLAFKNDLSSSMRVFKAFGRSFKQLVRYFQVMGVIFMFEVDWPELVREFFLLLSRFNVNVDLGSLLQTGCFQREQTIWGDMAFRWCTPLMVLLYCFLAIPFSQATSWLLRMVPHERTRTFGAKVGFGVDGAIKIWVLYLLLFYSSLVQSCFMMLVCSPGTNGIETVGNYPHLVCYQGEFWSYFPAAVAYSLAFGVTILSLMIYTLKQVVASIRQSRHLNRGGWAFIVDDFRESHIFWPLCIMAKDLLLNLLVVIFSGTGFAQLLIAGLMSLSYGLMVASEKPYQDNSNNLMEVATSVAAFAVCFLAAGMGFSSEPGTEDITAIFKEGAADSGFKRRAALLYMVQVSTVVVPFSIMFFQLLLVPSAIARRLPKAVKPMSDEERSSREAYLAAGLNGNVHRVLERLDSVEFGLLDNILSTSVGTAEFVNARGSLGLRSFIIGKLRSTAMRASLHVEVQRTISDRLEPAKSDKSDGALASDVGPADGEVQGAAN